MQDHRTIYGNSGLINLEVGAEQALRRFIPWRAAGPMAERPASPRPEGGSGGAGSSSMMASGCVQTGLSPPQSPLTDGGGSPILMAGGQRRLMVSYGLGDAGTGMAASLIGFYLFVFYTSAAGLPPWMAGLVLMLARIWDAINDPIVGWLSDRTRHPRRLDLW